MFASENALSLSDDFALTPISTPATASEDFETPDFDWENGVPRMDQSESTSDVGAREMGNGMGVRFADSDAQGRHSS
jgi:hypothetical protein